MNYRIMDLRTYETTLIEARSELEALHKLTGEYPTFPYKDFIVAYN